ncbi:ATP-grasp domain-containing protein [Neorhodopirellula pilleata]|uniref:hypothetical protein n=1 Tax=Neorhodopirellula pilleata TaxID=2714738 RepID=UPI001E4B68A9|nr:hypothetical protein [Neorhodopirellula pilleata]
MSEGSSNSARQVLYGLGRDHQIDLVDPSPWCQCRFSSLVRRRLACPPIGRDPLGYAKRVAEIVKTHDYDVLFPTHEQVYVFSKFRDVFQSHVGLAVPDFEAIRRVQSKTEFVELMNQMGLPIPASRIARDRAELLAHDDFPCFIKLAHSTASLGVQKVDNAEELLEAVQRFENNQSFKEGDSVLLQQPAPGVQSAVTAVFQEGRLIGYACAEILKTGIGGGPALRVSATHPPVQAHLERFGSALNWHGPVAIEYFYDEDTQQALYIEANPRIGETLNPTIAGVAICDAVTRISVGERMAPLSQAAPGVMSHNGFIVMIADAYNGASRTELLKRLLEHWLGRGEYGSCESEITRLREDPLSLVPATAVILRLLASPRSANGLAHATVENYSLPYAAARFIDELPEDALVGCGGLN